MPESDARSVRKRLAGLFCLLAALGLGLLARLVLEPERAAGGWIGYRALLVSARVPETEVLEKLDAAGIKDIICESTQPILVSNWSGLQSMSLAQAKTILVPGDPRFDVYLQRLALWFEARSGKQDYRAFYIKEAAPFGSGPSQDLVLDRGLAAFKGLYLLPGTGLKSAPRSQNPIFAASVFLVLLAACVLGPLLGRADSLSRALATRRPLWATLSRIGFRLSLALPWAAIAGYSLSAALWALALIEGAELLDAPLDEYRRGGRWTTVLASFSRQAAPALALPLAALVATVANPAALPCLGLAFLGSIAALPAFALLSSRQGSRPPFVPVPIGRKAFFSRREVSAAGIARALFACALLVAWALGRLLSPSFGQATDSEAEYPLPSPASGSLHPLVVEARTRAAAEAGEVPPGIGSYLEHRAYQEALPFVRLGEPRPDPFAPALLPAPTESSAGRPGSRTGSAPGSSANLRGVEFGDSWARSVYASVPPLSVEGMLLRQGSAQVARLSSTVTGGGGPLAPIEYLLYIFLLIPPIGRILSRVAPARGLASSELRQEA